MSAKYDVDMDVEALETSDPFDYYTKVIIVAGETEDGENIMGTAGDDSGKTFEVHIPLFSAPAGQSASVFDLADALAADILNQLKEYEYQPFDARGVIAPLEATLGDGIVINDIYSAINKQQIEFHPLVTFDYSSDSADDDDNEFGITKKSETERLLEGFVRYASTIEMHANSILAEVRSNAGAMSRIEQKVDAQGSSIALVVSDGQVNASAIIQAINGESSATISADRINLTAQIIKNTGVMTWGNLDTSDMPDYLTDDDLDGYISSSDFDDTVTEIYTAIDAKSVTAEYLKGRYINLLGNDGVTSCGQIEIVKTQSGGYGLSLSTQSLYVDGQWADENNGGIRFLSGDNMFLQAGKTGPTITMSTEGKLINLGGVLVVNGANWGEDSPVGTDGVNGQVFFQLVD